MTRSRWSLHFLIPPSLSALDRDTPADRRLSVPCSRRRRGTELDQGRAAEQGRGVGRSTYTPCPAMSICLTVAASYPRERKYCSAAATAAMTSD